MGYHFAYQVISLPFSKFSAYAFAIVAQKSDLLGRGISDLAHLCCEQVEGGIVVRYDLKIFEHYNLRNRLLADGESIILDLEQEEGSPWVISFISDQAYFRYSPCVKFFENNQSAADFVSNHFALEYIKKRFDIKIEEISRYFIDWKMVISPNGIEYKTQGFAYDGDVSQYGDSAQICDLLARLKLPEPTVPNFLGAVSS